MALKPALAGLTEKEAVFVSAYLRTADVPISSKEAGYAHRESGYAVLRRESVQNALHDARQRLICTEGATVAIQTLIDLMKPTSPPAVRLGAAKYVMGLAGHVEPTAGAGSGKALTDMTADELQAMLGKLDQALGEKADAAKPVYQVVDAAARSMDGLESQQDQGTAQP